MNKLAIIKDIILILAILVGLYLYEDSLNKPEPSQNMVKIERLQQSIDSLNLKKDSITKIENNLTKKYIINNNYYDSIKTTIYILPDSVELQRFFASLKRFDSIYFSAPSKGY